MANIANKLILAAIAAAGFAAKEEVENNFLLSPKERCKMATMTIEPVVIKTAMSNIGLRDKVEDLLDEIELQRRLKISEEQDNMGLGMTVAESKAKMKERMLRTWMADFFMR